MVPQCRGPIWEEDDFSACFREIFLKFELPLAACGISLVILLAQATYRLYYAKFANGGTKYQLIPQHEESERYDRESTDDPRDSIDSDDDRQDRQYGRGSEEAEPVLFHPSLTASDSYIEESHPSRQRTFHVLELLCVVSQICLSIYAIVTHAEDFKPACVRLVFWSYVLAIVSSRLLLPPAASYDGDLYPRFWNHALFLYAFQWLVGAMLCRSVYINPTSKSLRDITSVGFVLSTVLLLLVITMRKGEKTVFLRRREGITPCKEQTASLLSIGTYSWLDSLVWTGYRKTLELHDVWDLPTKYLASRIVSEYDSVRCATSLTASLFRYLGRPLLVQGLFAAIGGIPEFMAPILVKRVLEYVQDSEHKSRNAAWLYVGLLFVFGAITSVAGNLTLWIGRKVSTKLRAILTGKIYEKSLRRKAAAGGDHKTGSNESGRGKVEKDNDGDNKSEEASQGRIVNLMSIDSIKVSDVCAYLQFLWVDVPIQTFLSIFLLYRFVGSSALAGVLTLLVLMPLSGIIAQKFTTVETKILAATDGRVHATNEVLRNIRIIKYFAWEQIFEEQINEKRAVELRALRNRFLVWICAAFIWWAAPMLISLNTFWVYVKVQHQPLVPSVAFTAMSLFQLLRVQLDRLTDMMARIQESRASLDRIEKYLNEDETEKYHQLDSSLKSTEPKLMLENATLQWPAASHVSSPTPTDLSDAASVSGQTECFRLIGINVEFHIGGLNVIAGPTGSGKTSVLMALLGEMKLLSGDVYLPGGGADRSTLHPDPETGLTESIAYCAQEAWLINATVRENIVFSSYFDESRYEMVVQACALERDMQILGEGDQTLVGDKGLSLSGGQKQRISLARAMYSRARHLLLDDCLSAVDSHTAQHIVQNALLGPIMNGRTCVLVTHNVSLVASFADYVVFLNNGKVIAQGSVPEVAATPTGSVLLRTEDVKSPLSSVQPLAHVTRTNSAVTLQPGSSEAHPVNRNNKQSKRKQLARTVHKEKKAEGRVRWSTMFYFLATMGPWYFWVIALLLFPAGHFASVLPSLWIREWANSYVSPPSNQSISVTSASGTPYQSPVSSQSSSPVSSFSFPGIFTLQNLPGVQLFAERNAVDDTYYLVGYFLITLAYLTFATVSEALLCFGSLHASRIMHSRLLKSITRATFKFFDSTPLGQLMNRFSKDLEAIDQELVLMAHGTIQCFVGTLIVIAMITYIIPMFLSFVLFICVIFVIIGMLYLPVGRDLKRLDSVMQSPLFQHFGETLNGVVTIRAYGDCSRFAADNFARVDAANRPFFYLWATNRWLVSRLELTGALVSSVTAAFIILQVGKIDAGAAGIALTYAITFTENVMWCVRLYSMAEQQFNSVERVQEYIEVEHERPAILPDSRPPANWPENSEIEFKDYTTRYRQELEPVLRNINFKAHAGERIGVVGRTGAGKSSLALALLRGLEAAEGQICIDDIDISTIGLQDLRKAITMVPQDPTLFAGDIRSNLDPFGQFTDEDILTALRRVHLIEASENAQATSNGLDDHDNEQHTVSRASNEVAPDNINVFRNLNSPISESGSNVSQGQRQLLCLARAILRNPSILIMDEATASIDFFTDARIQETLRELRGNTIITIAHRLKTIIDYDKVLVLDHGTVKEFDSPWELINRRDGGIFRQMCQSSENFDVLVEGARVASARKNQR